MSQNAKRYTSVSKGGEFEMVGTSSGAGQRKGDVVIVYRNVETGQILHREPEDFAMRMKPAAPSINAQLLAALEFSRDVFHEMSMQARTKGDQQYFTELLAEGNAIDAAIAAAKGAV